jgi:hypothetical protein
MRPSQGWCLSLLDRTVVDNHRGWDSHPKDACLGLRHRPSREMERGKVQYRWQGRAFLFQITEDCKGKVRSSAPHTLPFIPSRKPKRPLETHTKDRAWRDKRTTLFTSEPHDTPLTVSGGAGPLVTSVGLPDVAGQLGMRAIMPMTLKRACSLQSNAEQPGYPRARST